LGGGVKAADEPVRRACRIAPEQHVCSELVRQPGFEVAPMMLNYRLSQNIFWSSRLPEIAIHLQSSLRI
jgi:hypothetical protein